MDSFESLKAIQISIASPEQIRAWSHGAVKKPETINYRSHKPERDGLFCERIFGPTRDYECFCGKYKSIRYKGIICERCGVEITKSSERRERMGHIELVTPVAHIWYSRGTPNYIAMLLDLTSRDFEKVLYFNSYIVLEPGNLPLMKMQILSEKEYLEYRSKYGDMFKAGMGAEAIKYLLKNLDLVKLIEDLKRKMREGGSSQKQNIVKRLNLAETFLHSKSRPEWMILDILPVIPPDLRPMVQLDGGRFATSDLNDLYRRVINRNNRLARLIKLNAPEIIIKNEKRMLQEAVNALIDNGRKGRPVTGPGNRPLKSLNDMLKGKQGRFRQNLLGKRVDYSGRSVIVVGPKLKMHQCGLPQSMALELFKPFIMHKLVDYGLAHNIKSAKKMIEREQQEVWGVLEEVVREHPILLNRAPTLHRHGIQAFLPVLVQGKAIQIHPLVCEAFNADFDGDQMAVHVPLLLPAKTESKVLLLSSHNLLKPANGRSVAGPSQDMAIGLFYLTLPRKTDKIIEVPVSSSAGRALSLERLLESSRSINFCLAEDLSRKNRKSGTWQVIFKKDHVFSADDIAILKEHGFKKVKIYKEIVMSDPDEVIVAYETGSLGLHDPIVVKVDGVYHNTTVGRVIVNQIIPKELGFKNQVLRKSDIVGLIEQAVGKCGQYRTAVFLDDLKSLGFKYATRSGLSISIKDLEVPGKKPEIVAKAEKKVAMLEDRKKQDPQEWKQQVVNIWLQASEEVTDAMLHNFKSKHERGEHNPIYMMAISGARGNIDQIKQLAGMRGLMANPKGDIIPVPIKANFREGLSMTDYFISTYGARKGLVDTALRTADSGYLTRRLVDVAQDTIVFQEDCGTTKGVLMTPLREKRTPTNTMVDEIIISLKQRIYGRMSARPVYHPATGEKILDAGCWIDEEKASEIAQSESIVPVDRLREDSLTGEVVVHPEKKTVVCAPDVAVTPMLKETLKEVGVKEIKVYPKVYVRSPMTCEARRGVCQHCYGYDLSTKKPVDIGVAVGVIAAQSIGEPGTQLTMRTFHTGGVAVSQKASIKARHDGIVSFDALQIQEKVPRGVYAVDKLGPDEEEKESDFEKVVRRVVLSGELLIKTPGGKVERYPMPVGAVLKVKDGDRVKVGTLLADHNPNEILTAEAGTVKYHNLEVRDGQVVSRKSSIRIMDGRKVLAEYEIPQRARLKVDDGDEVVAGDIIAEISLDERSAIAQIDGIVEFSNIKVKNQRVISEQGILYITPPDADEKAEVVEMPPGVKNVQDTTSGSIQELPLGSVLRVKNGDQVLEGDELAGIYSELEGEVELPDDKTIYVNSSSIKEHYITGNMEIQLDEDEKTLTFMSELSGKVKIISYRSSSNKTVDRRRIIIKDERVYVIPEGAQLRFDNLLVKPGDVVTEGQRITGLIPFVTEIDGVVEIRDIVLGEVINVASGNVHKSDLVGRVADESILAPKTGELITLKGETITEEMAERILEEAESIGKIVLQQLSATRCITIRSEDGTVKDYSIPEGAVVKVEDGQEVKAGTELIEPFAPIEVESGGKVNFITQYNRYTGEDHIKKIIVYSGRDYFLPVGIPLVVKNGQTIEKGEPISEPVKYETFEKQERGIKFTCLEKVSKKYYVNENTEVLVEDGRKVKVGTRLAVVKAPCPGVVKVIQALTKSGKVRSIVESVIIQPGEAHQIVDGAELLVKDGDFVKKGDILARWGTMGRKTTDIVQGLPRVSELFEIRKPKKEAVISGDYGRVAIRGYNIHLITEEGQTRIYQTEYGLANLLVHEGEIVEPGTRLTEGNVDPKVLTRVAGIEKVQRYLVDEVQQVYKSQGVSISDRHFEVIVRNMMKKVQVVKAGDTKFLPGEIVSRFRFIDENQRVMKEGKRPAEGIPVLQGITKAALTTDSFISAASFQETTKVLTRAAIESKIDRLYGLKENIIIGKLIPAGTGLFTGRIRFEFDDEAPKKKDTVSQEEREIEVLQRTLTADLEKMDEDSAIDKALETLKAVGEMEEEE